MALRLYISRTADGYKLPLPSYESPNHMGLRLQAAISGAMKIEPGERVYIPVGFAIGIPKGFCGQIVSFLHLVKEKGVVVMGSPTVLNPADRMPLYVLLQNQSGRAQIIKRGEYIAELLIVTANQAYWKEIEIDISSLQEKKETVSVGKFDEIEDTTEPKTPKKRVTKSIRSRTK